MTPTRDQTPVISLACWVLLLAATACGSPDPDAGNKGADATMDLPEVTTEFEWLETRATPPGTAAIIDWVPWCGPIAVEASERRTGPYPWAPRGSDGGDDSSRSPALALRLPVHVQARHLVLLVHQQLGGPLPGATEFWAAVRTGPAGQAWVRWPILGYRPTLAWELPDSNEPVPVRLALRPSKDGSGLDAIAVLAVNPDGTFVDSNSIRLAAPDRSLAGVLRALRDAKPRPEVGDDGPRNIEVILPSEATFGKVLPLLLRLQDAGRCSVSLVHTVW